MRLSKKDFSAGSPYSCWLKEEVIGEISAHLHGMKNRGLVKKYNIHVDDETEYVIMNVSKFDDLPNDIQLVAADIIRMELDKTFLKKI